jgi:hypothetical protein
MNKFVSSLAFIVFLSSPSLAQDVIPPSPSSVGTAAVGQIPGTLTNDEATVGKIGEYICQSVSLNSAIALTSASPIDITSLSLTPGDWDLRATVWFAGNSTTTVSLAQSGISQISASFPNPGTTDRQNQLFSAPFTPFTSATMSLPPVIIRESLSVPTTIYLVGQATFSAGTMSAFGQICSRRVR